MTADSIVVEIAGEIDASNASAFARYLEAHSAATDRFHVDLSDVTFFSTAGLSVLHHLQNSTRQCGGRWWLIPSPAVRKTLRVCNAQDLPQRETLRSSQPELV